MGFDIVKRTVDRALQDAARERRLEREAKEREAKNTPQPKDKP